MAKIELRQNPKFRRLARLLNLRDPYLVGHLECMWHVAYQRAARRDEAHFSDATEVEGAADWFGEEGVLCQALVDCRFLDVVADGYRVHDIADHAPDFVAKRIKRRTLADNGGQRRTETDDGRQRRVSQAKPSLEKPREGMTPPSNSGGAAASEGESARDSGSAFESSMDADLRQWHDHEFWPRFQRDHRGPSGPGTKTASWHECAIARPTPTERRAIIDWLTQRATIDTQMQDPPHWPGARRWWQERGWTAAMPKPRRPTRPAAPTDGDSGLYVVSGPGKGATP